MRRMQNTMLRGLLLLPLVFISCHWVRRSVPVQVRPAPSRGEPAPARTPPESAVPAIPEDGGYLTFALEEPFTGVGSAQMATYTDRMVRRLVFRGLTHETPQGELEPELASGWEELRRGQEWILHLRPGTSFGGGRYLEARHVAASWEALITHPTSPYSWLLEPVVGFEELRDGQAPHAAGLHLEDGLTLRVELKRPLPGFLWRLAHPALGVSVFGAGEDGIGPFSLWSTRGEEEVVLRSNPNYFRALPHLEELVFVTRKPDRALFAEAEALDGGMVLPGEEIPRGPAVRFFRHSVARTYILGLNRSVAPFSDPGKVRGLITNLDHITWSAPGAMAAEGRPPTLVPALATSRTVASVPPASSRLTGLGRLDLVLARNDPVAEMLMGELQALLTRAGARVVVHRARRSDLAGILRRHEFHVFLLPYVPSSLNSLLNYEELIRWNPTTPEGLLARLRLLETEKETEALLNGLRDLDTTLQAEGHLIPLLTVDRRFLVRSEICQLRPDPLGNLDWTLAWRSSRPSAGCGESHDQKR